MWNIHILVCNLAKQLYQQLKIILIIMLTRKLFKVCFGMCKITPSIYQKLFIDFSKNPQIKTFGSHFTNDNLIQVYNIVKHTQMNPVQKISALDQISEKLCSKNTDQQFNVLANIHRDKSMLYLQISKIPQAIIEIQRSIQSIQAMEEPFSIQVASILQTAANLHIKARNYVKAQKFLKDAEHTLNLTQQQILQNTEIPPEVKQQQIKYINSIMAKIMSQFCLTHMSQVHHFEARQYLAKALQRWNNVEDKNNMGYLLTNKFKCILHLWAKQQLSAIQTAKQYLEKFPPTQQTVGPRMWFMKFLVDKGVDTYAQQLKQNIEELSKKMGEKQLSEFLIRMGVLKKPKQSNKNQLKKE